MYVMVRVVLFLRFIPGIIGFLLIFTASTGGFLIPSFSLSRCKGSSGWVIPDFGRISSYRC